jgi:alpha-beta hydrolase superfamily lysophospholipase
MKYRKIFCYGLIIISIILFLGSVALYIAVEHILPYSPIRPHRITRKDIAQQFKGYATPSDFGLAFKPLDIVVEDSIHLKGWFLKSSKETSQGTVILLHGIASCKESWLTFADTLVKNGFNCVVYDSRAHGESDGINCTFGYYEKYDVSAVIQEVKREFDNPGPFAIIGHSMGAAVAIQAMVIDTNIVCGVIEAPFATLREILYDSWKQISGSCDHIIPDAALKNTEHIARFSVDSVKPEATAKMIHSPVMVIHGDADEKNSIEYGKRIYDNLTSREKIWYVIPNGDHDHLAEIGGTAYL